MAIKQQFSEMRNNTPKAVWWLVVAAVVVIVLILATLLFTKERRIVSVPDIKTELRFTVDPSNGRDLLKSAVVGVPTSVVVLVSANVPTKITEPLVVQAENKPDGLNVNSSCNHIRIEENLPCRINITFTPSAEMPVEECVIPIKYSAADAPEDVAPSETSFVFSVAATKPKIVAAPVQKTVSEPQPEPVQNPAESVASDESDESASLEWPDTTTKPYDDEYNNGENYVDDDKNNDSNIEDAVISIGGDDLLTKDSSVVAPPARRQSATPQADADASNTMLSGACSDFAFPGYNLFGRQIGWIKPKGGAYYFHPFSDTECDNPTGAYNPENGIISDINDNSIRIGTDAEHIGYGVITNGVMPKLSNPATQRNFIKATVANEESEIKTGSGRSVIGNDTDNDKGGLLRRREFKSDKFTGSGRESAVYSSQPYDREFVLRQYKPIPATIVSEVRADASLYDANSANIQLPVRATVDRNVYSDSGRTIIIPTGTLMLGYVTGTIPGPYKAIGRMQIKWYQFILPNGVEFNFNSKEKDPFSADSQGRAGVPGRGSTDYMEQFVMPMLTAIVPAAVNLIAPVADKFVNQIDLDNNTVVQSGTLRSSELAKNEIITAWNQVAQKLIVDAMDNTVPPFSIPAGTRINVYSPEDLIVSCGVSDDTGNAKKCALTPKDNEYSTRRDHTEVFKNNEARADYNDGTWVGQSRSFNWANKYCDSYKDGKFTDETVKQIYEDGLDYADVLFYCQSNQYQAINMAKQKALYENQQDVNNKKSIASTGGQGTKEYNTNVLGLKYDDDGAIQNPFQKEKQTNITSEEEEIIGCWDGSTPDANGCCTGETYTDMGEDGFNCCPDGGGACFPPIQ